MHWWTAHRQMWADAEERNAAAAYRRRGPASFLAWSERLLASCNHLYSGLADLGWRADRDDPDAALGG